MYAERDRWIQTQIQIFEFANLVRGASEVGIQSGAGREPRFRRTGADGCAWQSPELHTSPLGDVAKEMPAPCSISNRIARLELRPGSWGRCQQPTASDKLFVCSAPPSLAARGLQMSKLGRLKV